MSSRCSARWGSAEAARALGGRVVLGFTIEEEKNVEIELLADPDQLGHVDLTPLDD